jgi:hypothetical protein
MGLMRARVRVGSPRAGKARHHSFADPVERSISLSLSLTIYSSRLTVLAIITIARTVWGIRTYYVAYIRRLCIPSFAYEFTRRWCDTGISVFFLFVRMTYL